MKSQTIFTCANCDSQFPKWAGRCLSCGKWNTLAEQQVSRTLSNTDKVKAAKTVSLAEVDAVSLRRLDTGIPEVNLILGGSSGGPGLVPGSLLLLGGDPGIGKSTLALQMAVNLGAAGARILYVSGEESLPQVKMRASRLSGDLKAVQALSENNLDIILTTIEGQKPQVVVIDSIQTMYSEGASGVAGGVAQVSFATARILETVKPLGIAAIIIGHVTKEGNLAGPRMLEHMVDTVLYLEGERFLSFRILRCIKNRFGSTSEVGVFEMKESGLSVVSNPSSLFLSQRVTKQPGNAVTCTVEGTRALLLEIQSLTAKSQFNYPKKTATGFDINRLQLLTAVLQKRLHLNFFEQDVFLSVAGGFRVSETACDLAAALSLISSFKELPLPDDLAAVGEVGLSGEIRSVGQIERRMNEAAKLGFARIMVPAANKASSAKIKILPVADLQQATDLVFRK